MEKPKLIRFDETNFVKNSKIVLNMNFAIISKEKEFNFFDFKLEDDWVLMYSFDKINKSFKTICTKLNITNFDQYIFNNTDTLNTFVDKFNNLFTLIEDTF